MFKKIGLGFLALLVLVALFLTFGPREPVDETITFQSSALGSDLDAYLKAQEAKYSNITPGAEKQIIWNDPATKAKTPLSIVYVHGFSATLEEVRPLPDLIAKELGANLFYTRLSGHGRGGAAMAEPTVNDWFNDTVEALAVGRAIGEKVIVISVSTGSTLVTWAATKPELMQNIAGLVFISPNYGINNPAAPLLTLGGARTFLPWIVGAERKWEPHNAEHAKWWTTSYPTAAVFPMAASVKFVNKLDFFSANTPALFIYHLDDKVVDPEATALVAAFWGGPTTVEEITRAEDPHNHVIAGRALSPSNTEPFAKTITEWIKDR